MGVPGMTKGMQGGNRLYAGSFWHQVRKKPELAIIKSTKYLRFATMTNTVILVDDDQDHLDLLKLAFKQFDPTLFCISFVYADDAQKALASFNTLPKCILIDFNLPRKEGI